MKNGGPGAAVLVRPGEAGYFSALLVVAGATTVGRV
jgi:hypothetical protein